MSFMRRGEVSDACAQRLCDRDSKSDTAACSGLEPDAMQPWDGWVRPRHSENEHGMSATRSALAPVMRSVLCRRLGRREPGSANWLGHG
jgi:hypothetical protein